MDRTGQASDRPGPCRNIHLAVGFERSEVVFSIRVVGMTKIVVHRDGLDDLGDSLGAKGRYSSGDHGMTVRQVAAQLIIGGAAHH
jgi:hypothetical protein